MTNTTSPDAGTDKLPTAQISVSVGKARRHRPIPYSSITAMLKGWRSLARTYRSHAVQLFQIAKQSDSARRYQELARENYQRAYQVEQTLRCAEFEPACLEASLKLDLLLASAFFVVFIHVRPSGFLGVVYDTRTIDTYLFECERATIDETASALREWIVTADFRGLLGSEVAA